jgi:hypothetical protein
MKKPDENVSVFVNKKKLKSVSFLYTFRGEKCLVGNKMIV